MPRSASQRPALATSAPTRSTSAVRIGSSLQALMATSIFATPALVLMAPRLGCWHAAVATFLLPRPEPAWLKQGTQVASGALVVGPPFPRKLALPIQSSFPVARELDVLAPSSCNLLIPTTHTLDAIALLVWTGTQREVAAPAAPHDTPVLPWLWRPSGLSWGSF